jgi:acetyl esterase/lipase
MYAQRIDIWEGYEYEGKGADGFRPSMETYVLSGEKKRPLVLICPGGGYRFVSPREAEPIALQFNAAGFHACVLTYSVAPRRHPQPLRDLSRAMCLIRENASAWRVNPAEIAVCGFSAGGHLAASLGVHWMKSYLEGIPGIVLPENRPNALVLAYPVITSGTHAHEGSFENLLGQDADRHERQEMSLELHVSQNTPPSFLWHTFEDAGVPVENTLLFANALRSSGIPFELHVYPDGSHGLSLATEETADGPGRENPHVASWMSMCTEWLHTVFADGSSAGAN